MSAFYLRLLPSFSGPRRTVTTLLATVAMLVVGGRFAAGEPAKPSAPVAPATLLSNEELLRNFQCMEQRLRALEGQLNSQTATPPVAGTGVPAEGALSKTAEPPKPFPTRFVRIPDIDAKAKKPANKDTANPTASAPEPNASAAEPAAKSATPPGKPTAAPKAGAAPCASQPKAQSSTEVAKASPPLLPPLPGGPATPGNKGILGVADSPVAGLSIGAYGEIKYGSMQNPAANGQWQNGFDAHRWSCCRPMRSPPTSSSMRKSSSSTEASHSTRTRSCTVRSMSSRYSSTSLSR